MVFIDKTAAHVRTLRTMFSRRVTVETIHARSSTWAARWCLFQRAVLDPIQIRLTDPLVNNSHNRSRVFLLYRLNHVPRFVERLNFRASIAGAFPCVAQRWIAGVFAAVNGTDALSFEDISAALFLPARIAW